MAHIGHNVLAAYLDFTFNDHMTNRLYAWYHENDQKKIVVTASFKEINDIIHMINLDIPYSILDDVNYGYPICGVVGPVSDEEASEYGLDKLPLFKLRLVY